MNANNATLESRAQAARPRTRPRTFQRPRDLSDPEFPIALRGYDRAAVDEYVAEVNKVLTELRSSHSPQTAVREALDRVGEETSSILQRAHETADAITTAARNDATQQISSATRASDRLREAADQHAEKVARDTQSLWDERTVMLDDMRKLAETLLEVADSASERLSSPQVDLPSMGTYADEAPEVFEEAPPAAATIDETEVDSGEHDGAPEEAAAVAPDAGEHEPGAAQPAVEPDSESWRTQPPNGPGMSARRDPANGNGSGHVDVPTQQMDALTITDDQLPRFNMGSWGS